MRIMQLGRTTVREKVFLTSCLGLIRVASSKLPFQWCLHLKGPSMSLVLGQFVLGISCRSLGGHGYIAWVGQRTFPFRAMAPPVGSFGPSGPALESFLGRPRLAERTALPVLAISTKGSQSIVGVPLQSDTCTHTHRVSCVMLRHIFR